MSDFGTKPVFGRPDFRHLLYVQYNLWSSYFTLYSWVPEIITLKFNSKCWYAKGLTFGKLSFSFHFTPNWTCNIRFKIWNQRFGLIDAQSTSKQNSLTWFGQKCVKSKKKSFDLKQFKIQTQHSSNEFGSILRIWTNLHLALNNLPKACQGLFKN